MLGNSQQAKRNIIAGILYLLAFTGMITAEAQCVSTKPNGLYVSDKAPCHLMLHWNSDSTAQFYKVKFKTTTSTWSQPTSVNLDTTFTFSGLLPNTSYILSVGSFCSIEAKGVWSSVKTTSPNCSAPVIQNIKVSDSGSVFIQWSNCGSGNNKIRYRLTTETKWTTSFTGSVQSVTLSGLEGDYVFKVSACDNGTNWSPVDTFSVHKKDKRPNILLIVLDDARWDAFGPNGGPSFFQSPYINRIANEGVNFKLTIPASSQCGPSRASIYTGLYPHHHGLGNNFDSIIHGLPMIQQILKDNGYYTGFVGKYGQGEENIAGFDWWATSNSENYVDVPYSINGVDTIIQGNILDTYPQLALTFLNSTPTDSPFCLMYFTRAPHGPTIPRVQDAQLYLDDTMPFPSNFNTYADDYPSFFYKMNLWKKDSSKTVADRRAEFQVLTAVEDNVKTLMTNIEQKGVLDNTLIMFISDNGFLKGEHMMSGKQVAQEESILVPFFIRYPKWFSDSTVIADQFASNVDIAPTLLEAAGIPDTFSMDGISLHKLAAGDLQRKEFFYEFAGQLSTPPLRAVRSLQYKYIYYYCDMVTEEFYDLINDPHENNNLINYPEYDSIINVYRQKLDQLKVIYGDTLSVETIPCYLQNANKLMHADEEDYSERFSDLQIFPNPASGQVSLIWSQEHSAPVTILVYDVFGKEKIRIGDNAMQGANSIILDVSPLIPGNYLVEVKTNEITSTQRIVIIN